LDSQHKNDTSERFGGEGWT